MIFLPSAAGVVERMLALARVGPQDVVYDLGCGDGRIPIAAAKRRGARGVCVDIDPARIAESRRNADTAGVTGRVEFVQGDLFETDLSRATVVTLYLLRALNLRLRPKLFRELRPGTRILSHSFDMADWRPDSTVRIEWRPGSTSTVYYWVLPADLAGTWELTLPRAGPDRRYRVRFEQRYQQLSGTASAAGRTVPLTAARVEGTLVEFTLTDTLAGRATALRFRGRVSGAALGGTVVAAPDTVGRPWRAVRP